MKQYLRYLLQTLKIFGIITLIVSPILAIIITSYYFNNYYILFFFIPYVILLIPYLIVIGKKYEFL